MAASVSSYLSEGELTLSDEDEEMLDHKFEGAEGGDGDVDDFRNFFFFVAN